MDCHHQSKGQFDNKVLHNSPGQLHSNPIESSSVMDQHKDFLHRKSSFQPGMKMVKLLV